jgi:hypothetical protein
MYPNQVNLDQATQAVPVGTPANTPSSNFLPNVNPTPNVVQTPQGSQGSQVVPPSYGWGQPQMNQNISYPNFNPMYSTQDYDVMGGNMPTTILPPTQGDMYGLPEDEYLEDTPENMKSKSTQEMKFGAYKTKKK